MSGGTGIEQKADHLNLASWKGDIWVLGMQLVSAWKSGHYLVESDPGLASFEPAKKLAECEQRGTDLLNPFGMGTYEEMECYGPCLGNGGPSPREHSHAGC